MTSTAGRTLADEGFIHASQAAQVAGVANMFYRDSADDLVVLVIDTGLVRAPVRYEDVPGADAPFPHIYGPLNTDAVVDVRPLPAGARGRVHVHAWPYASMIAGPGAGSAKLCVMRNQFMAYAHLTLGSTVRAGESAAAVRAS